MSKKRYEYFIVPNNGGTALLIKGSMLKKFPYAIVVNNHIGMPEYFKMGEMGLIRSLKMSFQVGKLLSDRLLDSDAVQVMRREIKPTT